MWLGLLVFFSYRKSLGLSLYADDWITISKALHYFEGFDLGKIIYYFFNDTWVSHYAFQSIIGIIWSAFGLNSLPYFIINLLCRSLAAFGIYLFGKRMLNGLVGIAAASTFALSSIGAESTDYVYNLSSYLGLFLGFVVLPSLLYKDIKKHLLGWGLLTISYFVVPIRLYPLFFSLPVLEMALALKKLKDGEVKGWKQVILFPSLSVVLLLLLKLIFPLEMSSLAPGAISFGWNLVLSMVNIGRFDFVLYPFLNIGRALEPLGLATDFSYPPSLKFFMVLFLSILGIAWAWLIGKTGKERQTLVFFGITLAFLLGIFVKYQGSWQLVNPSSFFWTYLGMLLGFLIIYQLVVKFLKSSQSEFFYSLVSAISIGGFIFPQISNPQIIFEPTHRYLTLSGVGVSLILAEIFAKAFKTKSKMTQVLIGGVLFIFVGTQLIAGDKYFSHLQEIRSAKVNDALFTQLKQLLPAIPSGHPTVFYFEYPNPETYYALLYSSFGYHLQLIYGLPFDEVNIASSVATYPDLKREVKNRQIPRDFILGFRWENGTLVNISGEVQNNLFSKEY